MGNAEDWNELSETWTESAPDAPAIDTDALLKRVRRAHWRSRAALIADVSISVLVAILVGTRVLSGEATLKDWFALDLIGFAIILSFWARRGTWSNRWDSLDALVTAAERQALAGIRCSQAGYAIIVIGAVWVSMSFFTERVASDPLRVWTMVGLLIYLALFAVLSRSFELRRRRQLEEARTLRAKMHGGPKATEDL